MVKLQKVSVMALARLFCVFHAAVGLILGIIVTIGSMTGSQEDGFWSLGAWSLVVFPVLNAILGFVTGAFLAWSYNLLSQKIGGIEFELEEQPTLM